MTIREKERRGPDQAGAQTRAQTRMPAAIATGARSRRMARSYVMARQLADEEHNGNSPAFAWFLQGDLGVASA